MSKKGDGIRISIGGAGYAGGSSGYSLAGSGSGYSLTGSGKGYSLNAGLDSSLKTGYSSIAAGGYSSGMKMKGYSMRQLYPVNLFPVPYRRIKDGVAELLKLYRKKCPHCGAISANYSLN
jgi:hypothetical protein